MNAWHFTNGTLRDGRPIPAIGETLCHDGALRLCDIGLHASRNILDALHYAPGSIVHRVVCGGEIITGEDKLVCRERTILWSVDAERVLHKFARLCAMDVIHLWDAPEVVVRYLRTGDESIRGAARVAGWAVGWEAESKAARAALRAAVWESGWVAEWEAAREAAAFAREAAAFARAAVRTAAKAATRTATRTKQSKRLVRLVRRAKEAGE